MGENGYIDFCLLLSMLLNVRSTYAHVNPLNGELCPRVLGVCTGPQAGGQAGRHRHRQAQARSTLLACMTRRVGARCSLCVNSIRKGRGGDFQIWYTGSGTRLFGGGDNALVIGAQVPGLVALGGCQLGLCLPARTFSLTSDPIISEVCLRLMGGFLDISDYGSGCSLFFIREILAR